MSQVDTSAPPSSETPRTTLSRPEMLNAALKAVREISRAVDQGRTWDTIDRALACRAPDTTVDDRLSRIETSLQQLHSHHPAATYIGQGLLFLPTTLGFPLIGFADDLQITASLLTHRYWDAPTTQMLDRLLEPGQRFLDIGANVGYFTVFAASRVGFEGRVHAFEANPRTFDLLTRNVRLNVCSHVCDLHGVALADVPGERTLRTFVRNQGGSTLTELPDTLLDQWHERPQEIRITATTLDEAFAGHDVVFDCIKMDAEGSEGLIWKGGDRFFREHVDDRTLILMEWNPPALAGSGTAPTDVMALFARHAFHVWRREPDQTLTRLESAAALDPWCNSELLLARAPGRIVQALS